MKLELEMLPSSMVEVQVGSCSPPREYETTSKSFLLETMPVDLHTETVACRFLETGVVGRCKEEANETSKTIPENDCAKKRIESAGSARPVNNRPRHSFSKSSASLQSLVRRKSRKPGASSLPLEAELSSYSSHPGCLLDTPKENIVTFRDDEETCTTTRTSTLIYTSNAQPSSRGGSNVQDISSTTNVANVATATTTSSTSNVTSSASGSHFGNTASSLIRTTSVITAGPSTSSWNNSTEQESDYVVDPVQGNAYHKGQFLGKIQTSDSPKMTVHILGIFLGFLSCSEDDVTLFK